MNKTYQESELESKTDSERGTVKFQLTYDGELVTIKDNTYQYVSIDAKDLYYELERLFRSGLG